MCSNLFDAADGIGRIGDADVAKLKQLTFQIEHFDDRSMYTKATKNPRW
jgi:hypothetical protein